MRVGWAVPLIGSYSYFEGFLNSPICSIYFKCLAFPFRKPHFLQNCFSFFAKIFIPKSKDPLPVDPWRRTIPLYIFPPWIHTTNRWHIQTKLQHKKRDNDLLRPVHFKIASNQLFSFKIKWEIYCHVNGFWDWLIDFDPKLNMN